MPRYTSKAYLGLPGQVKRYRPNTVSADDLLAIYLEQLVSEMDEKTVVCQFFNPTVSVTEQILSM